MNNIQTTFLKTPMGVLKITGTQNGICAIELSREIEHDDIPFLLKPAYIQIGEYFNGYRKKFDLRLDIKGTEFQKKVWKEVMNIPYGKTASYKDIATRIFRNKAYRAVGMANSKNMLPIVIPCHRVIGGDGTLTGYAWGIENKQYLLDIEKNG